MLRRLSRLGAAIIDFVYPPQCLACSADEHAPESPHLCATCLDALYTEAVPPPFDLAAQFIHRGLRVYFEECLAAWPFSEKVQRLMHAMKYEGKRSLARLLAKGMSTRIAHLHGESPDSTVIVPVPMHPRRRRERGYNHSALLANELSNLWKMPVNVKALRRVRDTPQQALLSADERRRNVQDAFAVKPPGAFVNKRILLIDDVVTTGSTINACANALKSAGAVRVWVIAAARA